jgi:hypothetical protein
VKRPITDWFPLHKLAKANRHPTYGWRQEPEQKPTVTMRERCLDCEEVILTEYHVTISLGIGRVSGMICDDCWKKIREQIIDARFNGTLPPEETRGLTYDETDKTVRDNWQRPLKGDTGFVNQIETENTNGD